MKGARSHQRSSTSGVALIIVLALMALVMVLVLAVLSISSGQVKQERLMTESAGAEALARLPADLILAQLQRATTQGVTSSGEPVLWTSQPGMIRTFGSRVEPGETRPQPRMHYRLYSTPVMNSPTLDVAAEATATAQWATQAAGFTDLNEPVISFRSGTPETIFPIADPSTLGVMDGYALRSSAAGVNHGHPLPLPVAWIYVLKDGQFLLPRSVNEEGAQFESSRATQNNPIVGRIAFWTDDESCKLNLNTASEAEPWDMPVANTFTERGYAARMPSSTEHYRLSAHPAFTSLSAVMKHFGSNHTGNVQWPPPEPANPLDAESSSWWRRYLACYQSLVPHGAVSSPLAGSVPMLQQSRHFASVDEFYLSPTRTRNGAALGFAMTASDLRKARFLLTTHSNAPELNPFGAPKIALWPMAQDATQRSLQDQRMCLCASMNPQSAAQDRHPFFFQRASTSSSQSMLEDWTLVLRNRELYAWLQHQSEQPLPGFGRRFVDKYGERSRDQVLTSMFDMLRWSDTTALPSSLGTARQSAVPLVIERTDANGTTTSTRGFGRFPTITEIAVVFAFTDVERKPDGSPRDDNKDGICDRATKLRAFMVVNPFVVAAGQPGVSPAWTLRFRRLMHWTVGKGLSLQLPGGNVFSRCTFSGRLPAGEDESWGGDTTAFASFAAQFLQADGTPKLIGKRNDPARDFCFISNNDVTLARDDGKPGGQLAFSGGRIILDILAADAAPSSPRPGDSLHSIEVEFPNNPASPITLPVPSLRVSDFIGGPRRLKDRFIPVREGKAWRLPLIQRGDIVRSMVLNPNGPSRGDVRLLAAKRELFYPEAADWFHPHPDYATTKTQAQSLRDGSFMLEGQFGTVGDETQPQATRDTAGTLLPGTRVASNAIPAVTLGVQGAWQVATASDPGMRPGDWESGVGALEDGSLVNRLAVPASNVFSRCASAGFDETTLPTLSSGIQFGALPSGVYGTAADDTPRPWQTLLFCPNPSSRTTPANLPGRYDDSGHDHFGFATPPDHLWLEFFWQPTIEPWPMSQGFATEGKVNLNFQVMPWTWLRRATAMHGALQGVRMTAIPTRALMAEDHSSKGHDDGSAIEETFRYAINADKTLAAFEQRFDAGEVFRTPSEICEMFLVPKRITGHLYDSANFTPADPENLQTADMMNWWNGDEADATDAFEATGDNLRESPYALLYPRLCTQSNVYSVHYRVQLLQKSRSTTAETWIEGRDHVVSERRGSYVIERRFAPGPSPLPDSATSETAVSLHTLQKFSIVAHDRFDP